MGEIDSHYIFHNHQQLVLGGTLQLAIPSERKATRSRRCKL